MQEKESTWSLASHQAWTLVQSSDDGRENSLFPVEIIRVTEPETYCDRFQSMHLDESRPWPPVHSARSIDILFDVVKREIRRYYWCTSIEQGAFGIPVELHAMSQLVMSWSRREHTFSCVERTNPERNRHSCSSFLAKNKVQDMSSVARRRCTSVPDRNHHP